MKLKLLLPIFYLRRNFMRLMFIFSAVCISRALLLSFLRAYDLTYLLDYDLLKVPTVLGIDDKLKYELMVQRALDTDNVALMGFFNQSFFTLFIYYLSIKSLGDLGPIVLNTFLIAFVLPWHPRSLGLTYWPYFSIWLILLFRLAFMCSGPSKDFFSVIILASIINHQTRGHDILDNIGFFLLQLLVRPAVGIAYVIAYIMAAVFLRLFSRSACVLPTFTKLSLRMVIIAFSFFGFIALILLLPSLVLPLLQIDPYEYISAITFKPSSYILSVPAAFVSPFPYYFQNIFPHLTSLFNYRPYQVLAALDYIVYPPCLFVAAWTAWRLLPFNNRNHLPTTWFDHKNLGTLTVLFVASLLVLTGLLSYVWRGSSLVITAFLLGINLGNELLLHSRTSSTS